MFFSVRLLFIFSLVLISACQPQSEENVVIKNAGIFEPVEITVVGGEDLGEFLVGGDPVIITVKVKNNSRYNLTDLDLVVDEEDSSAGMKFNPNELGKSFSPGVGGTCTGVLAPKTTCEYKIYYQPSIPGDLNQKLVVHYKNLVKEQYKYFELNLLAGEAASLIFESEQINYNLGSLERTSQEKKEYELVIVNTGGLNAKEIRFSTNGSHTSEPFKVKSNDCPDFLAPKESCKVVVEYQSKNYSASAPDGNTDKLNYLFDISADYIRDPVGGTSTLTAYFQATSKEIRGEFASAGLKTLNFEPKVVGNIESKDMRLTNKGEREGIIHFIEVVDNTNTLIARCVREGTDQRLSCRAPNTYTDSSTEIGVLNLPYKIDDVDSCVNDLSKLNYSRNSDGSLSDTSLKAVAGGADGEGESCNFRVTFHPSNQLTTNGNFNGWDFFVVFDTTWKSQVDIRGYQSHPVTGVVAEELFDVDQATYRSAADLSVNSFVYANTTYTAEPTSTQNAQLFDLGRISLISSDAYREQVQIDFNNTGGHEASIVSITDSSTPSKTVTDTSTDFNSYYQNVSHTGCSVLNRVDGSCSLRFHLAPVAASGANASDIENGLMFDNTAARQKTFTLTYRNGATFNDDMTAVPDQVINVTLQALLVRKGYLVFRTTPQAQGDIGNKIAGNTDFYHVMIENVGTGGIPYIGGGNGRITYPNPLDVFPFQFIDRPAGENGADKDCFELIDFDGTSQPTNMGSNQPSVLDPGEVCSLTVQYNLKSNDLRARGFYNDTNPEWDRNFYQSDNPQDRWEFLNPSASWSFSLEYYDGDGIADAVNGYTPDISGYGNQQAIGGGTSGNFNLAVNYRQEGEAIPYYPLPVVSAAIYRESFSLPTVAPTGSEWGNTVSGGNIPPMFMDYGNTRGRAPASHWADTVNYGMMAGIFNPGLDYTYYMGAFKIGSGTHRVSYTLRNTGNNNITPVVDNFDPNGSTEITRVTPALTTFGSQERIEFDITPTQFGQPFTIHTFAFQNGRHTVSDWNNLSLTPDTVGITNAIIFDVLPANTGEITAELNTFTTSFNTSTQTVDEVYNPTSSTINTYFHGANESEVVRFEGIRGSGVYDKKRFTFTNSGAFPILNVRFHLTKLVRDVVDTDANGAGYTVSATTCNNVTLNPGQTCSVDIQFLAGLNEPLKTTRYAYVSYDQGPVNNLTGLFTKKGFKIEFEAADPAILAINNTTSESIYDENNNIISDSYPINLGFYDDASHPLLNDYPNQVVATNGVNLVNSSEEKASLLAQYRTFVGNATAEVPTTGDWIQIYNTNGIDIDANRACFYGDDEFDNSVPIDEKGFNSDTVAQCRVNIRKSFDSSILGGEIPSGQGYAGLTYYNSKRTSTSTFYFHLKGFVEPNRSNFPGTDISNVSSSSDGTVTFSWDAFSPQNSAWGAITGYRVFYAAGSNVLSNIFSSSNLSFVDTTGTTATITGLSSNKYYYFKIVAKRSTPTGTEYLSDSNLGVREIVVPSDNHFYNYALRAIIDRFTTDLDGDSFMSKDEATTACNNARLQISRNGGDVSITKRLITDEIYELIDATDEGSDYLYQYSPHWVADTPVDISGIFSGFNCSNKTGTDNDNFRYYIKSCGDCSCNTLPIIRGSDGRDYPPNSTIYSDPTILSSHARCYTIQ